MDQKPISHEVLLAVLQAQTDNLKQTIERNEAMQRDSIADLKRQVQISTEDTNKKIDQLWTSINNYVTQKEFSPVKIIVFGMAGLIMASVFGALLSKIIM